MGKYNVKVLVPDTSVIIKGIISDYLEKGIIKTQKIIINEAVLGELECQANSKRKIGKEGLEEIKKIRRIAKKKKIEISYSGRRPSPAEIKNAKRGGDIDCLIRDIAYVEKGTLITSDRVQALVADAKGIKNILIRHKSSVKKTGIESFFRKDVCKVYLTEGEKLKIKKCVSGKIKTINVGKRFFKSEEILDLFDELSEEAFTREDGFIESVRGSTKIIRVGDLKALMIKRPISSKTKVVIFKKKKRPFSSYKIKPSVFRKYENLIIMGEYESGKTTFVSSLIDSFKDVGVISDDFDNLFDEVSVYKKNNETIDIIKELKPEYIFTGEVFYPEDIDLIKTMQKTKIKTIFEVRENKISDMVERIIKLGGLDILKEGLIVLLEKGKIKGMFILKKKDNIISVLDFYKKKRVYEIEEC